MMPRETTLAMKMITCSFLVVFGGDTIGDKMITYRFFCLGEFFSVILTGNFTA